MSKTSFDIGIRWAIFALVSSLCHHFGPAFAPLGEVGQQTRLADYADLITPFAVVGTAVWALTALPAVGKIHWAVFVFGALLYVEGHGLHLAANSINNQLPTGPSAIATHWWDEVLGHYFWYIGFAVMTACITLRSNMATAMTPLRYLAAVVFGIAVFTTSVEGAIVPMAFAINAAFIVAGLKSRVGLRRDVLIAYGLATLLLAIFGLWQSGFPEFSELGWI